MFVVSHIVQILFSCDFGQVIEVNQNSLNPTCTGMDWCQIVEYSGLSDNTYLAPVLGLYN